MALASVCAVTGSASTTHAGLSQRGRAAQPKAQGKRISHAHFCQIPTAAAQTATLLLLLITVSAGTSGEPALAPQGAAQESMTGGGPSTLPLPLGLTLIHGCSGQTAPQ
jgi:hypothetical protein